jgi:hypothetical protein
MFSHPETLRVFSFSMRLLLSTVLVGLYSEIRVMYFLIRTKPKKEDKL